MKRGTIISILILICLVQLTSADMIIQQQPAKDYSMGDVVTIPIKITTSVGINQFLTVNLICNGVETNVHKEYIVLEAGNERQSTITIPLIKDFTTRSSGTCKLKAKLNEEFVLTNEFKISSDITVKILSTKKRSL